MPSFAPMHATTVQVRFADTDALGHVNNARYAEYVEAARLDFFRAVDIEVEALILARLEIDFRAQLRARPEVHVHTGVERLGRTSVTMTHRICERADGDDWGQVFAEARAVVVLFSYATNRPAELTAELRAALGSYVVA